MRGRALVYGLNKNMLGLSRRGLQIVMTRRSLRYEPRWLEAKVEWLEPHSEDLLGDGQVNQGVVRKQKRQPKVLPIGW